MTPSTSLQVFLAHSKEDKPVAWEIFHLLQLDGFIPWIDKGNLLPGQDWKLQIEKAVQASQALIVFISLSAMNRSGYLHKEIRLAIEVANQQPQGAIYIIPICLDNCEPPKQLSHLHYSMIPRESVADIYITLRSSLLSRAAELGIISAEQLEEMPTPWFMVKGGSPSQLRPGRYLVRGLNPDRDQSRYYGIAEVDKPDDNYLITWYIGDHKIKGRGQVPLGNEPVHVSVPEKYEVTFSRESSMSGFYECSWGSRGTEQLIPASPMMPGLTCLHLLSTAQ